MSEARPAPRNLALVATAFFAVMLGTTLPTPLYPLYQSRYGFSELMVTVIFAVYALSVVAGLVLVGRLSDTVGRRPLLIPGVLLSAASAVAFATSGGLGLILLGRVLSGFSAAIFTGTATATLVDLAPQDQRARATTVAVAANLGGLGVGQLLSGLLAQFAPDPLQLPYLVDLGLLAVALLGLLLVPETVLQRRLVWRLPHLGVPPQVRAAFIPAAVAGFCGFAVFGLFGSVVPGFLVTSLHLNHPALTGGIAFVLLATSVVGQIGAVGRLPVQRALPLGCTLLVVGALLTAASVAFTQLAPLVAASPVLGLGQGMVVGAGLASINECTPPERRGEVASTYFVVLYVGLAVPVIGLGFAGQALGTKVAGVAFNVLMAAAVAAVLAVLARRARQGGARPQGAKATAA